ncbi:hypothetical protein Tco_0016772 [Tanacetum coccineum]
MMLKCQELWECLKARFVEPEKRLDSAHDRFRTLISTSRQSTVDDKSEIITKSECSGFIKQLKVLSTLLSTQMKSYANRANGSKEKRIVPIEDSNSKALIAKDSQGEIDLTKEFVDDPVTFAMVALNGIEEDDLSIEIDADHVDPWQDRLEFFD